MPFQTEKTHLICSQLTDMDHKKLFNKYPSSSSHAKIYVCLQLDLLKATSIYVSWARDKSQSSTFILGIHNFENNCASFAQVAAFVRQCGQL
jgi:hypothetical protein